MEVLVMSDVVATRLDPKPRSELQAEAERRGIPLADVLRERVRRQRGKPEPKGRIVYAAPWNTGEELRASVETFRGCDVASIRVWYQDDAGGWRPGKKGINCGLDRLPLVEKAVAAIFAVTGTRDDEEVEEDGI